MAIIRREQIAGMNCHYYNYSLDYFFNSLERAGYMSVALWGGAPHFSMDYISYSDCGKIRRQAAAHNLDIICFTSASCTYGYQMCMQPPELFKKSYKYFSNGIKAASELGCNMMVTNSGWGYWNEDRESAWARSREMLYRLSEVAEQEGIVLTMESLRRAESQLVVTVGDAKKMYEEVNHPALKMMIDTTAVGVAGETIRQWFDIFGKDLVNTHFVDGTPYGHLVWGDGKIPLDSALQCLNDNGYEGYLGLEVTDSRYFNDPALADLRNMQALERFIYE